MLTLGYSTPIEYPVPEGIAIEVEASTRVTVRGADRGRVGQVASEIRSFRPHGALQGQGHPLRHRARPAQGRQERDQVELRGHDMRKMDEKTRRRLKRKASIRKRVSGTAERPRLSVYKSNRYTYVQAIDDASGRTLASASNLEKDAPRHQERRGRSRPPGRADRLAPQGAVHRDGGLRQERREVPRQGQGRRRGRPQGRHPVLRGKQWHSNARGRAASSSRSSSS